MQQELPPHPRYEVQKTKDTADAVAYAFLDKVGDPVQYPYKYPTIGDEEVRIQITYTGLCHSDCLHTRNLWNPYLEHPDCPGHEVVGVVSHVGKAVTKFKVGDKAAANPQRFMCQNCDHCKSGNNNLCSGFTGLYDDRYYGGYSTHIQLLERMVFHIPEGFNEEAGSPLLCAGVTVYAPIYRFNRPNSKCAVIGIGGLGHLAIKFAAKMGMEVTAFSTSNAREAEFKSFGATKISHSTNLENLDKEKGQYDLVINTLYIEDEQVFKAHQRLTAPNGNYVQVGAPPTSVNFRLDHAYIILNQIRVHGSIIGSYAETEDMLRFATEHNVYPTVEVFEFEEFPQAFAKLEKGRPHYRCVVNVGKWTKANGLWK